MSKMGSQSVVAYGLADLPEAFVWVFISKHTHFIYPQGSNLQNAVFCGSKIHFEVAFFDA